MVESSQYSKMSEPQVATFACCSINQWAMDFKGNLDRIIRSIKEAKDHGARIRVGPEMEVCGYSCEDHFLEIDTFKHSMQVLAEILKLSKQLEYSHMLLTIGMPILFEQVPYNSMIFVLKGEIVLVRPKITLANDGNYRELRWFVPWNQKVNPKTAQLKELHLPKFITSINGQIKCPIGDAILQTKDGYRIGVEFCEELWSPEDMLTKLSHQGCHIIVNSSGSYHTLRKLSRRVQLIQAATTKSGGVYLYANLLGCDGTRLCFDGSSMVILNGDICSISQQFTLQTTDIAFATVDLQQIDQYRVKVSQSRQMQASKLDISQRLPIINIENFKLTHDQPKQITPLVNLQLFSFQEEIARGPAL